MKSAIHCFLIATAVTALSNCTSTTRVVEVRPYHVETVKPKPRTPAPVEMKVVNQYDNKQ